MPQPYHPWYRSCIHLLPCLLAYSYYRSCSCSPFNQCSRAELHRATRRYTDYHRLAYRDFWSRSFSPRQRHHNIPQPAHYSHDSDPWCTQHHCRYSPASSRFARQRSWIHDKSCWASLNRGRDRYSLPHCYSCCSCDADPWCYYKPRHPSNDYGIPRHSVEPQHSTEPRQLSCNHTEHGTLVLTVSGHSGPAHAVPHRTPVPRHGIPFPPLQSHSTLALAMLNQAMSTKAMLGHSSPALTMQSQNVTVRPCATPRHTAPSCARPCHPSPSHADRHACSPRHPRPRRASRCGSTFCHRHSNRSFTCSRDRHRHWTPCSSLGHRSRTRPHPRSCSPPTDHEDYPSYSEKVTQVRQLFTESPVMAAHPPIPTRAKDTNLASQLTSKHFTEPQHPTEPWWSSCTRTKPWCPSPSHAGPWRASHSRVIPCGSSLTHAAPRVPVWAMSTHSIQVEAMSSHGIEVQAVANHGILAQAMSGHGEPHGAMPGHMDSTQPALNFTAVHPDVSGHVQLHVPALLPGMVTQATPPSAPGMDVAYSHMAAYATAQGIAHYLVPGPPILLGARCLTVSLRTHQ